MKTPTDAHAQLDVRQLQRGGALAPGNVVNRRWPGAGADAWVRLAARDGYADLVYQVAGVTRSQRVKLAYTFPNYGGRRPWFVCSCGERVAILYKAGQRWQCRVCSDLDYQTQHEDRFMRAHRRMKAIHERLDNPDASLIWPGIPPQPPRMHSATYYRLLAQLVRCHREMFGHLGDPAELLARLGS